MVLKKEVMKTQSKELEKGAEYRHLLVHAIHECAAGFPDIAGSVVHLLMDFLGDANSASALDVIFFVREIMVGCVGSGCRLQGLGSDRVCWGILPRHAVNVRESQQLVSGFNPGHPRPSPGRRQQRLRARRHLLMREIMVCRYVCASTSRSSTVFIVDPDVPWLEGLQGITTESC